MFRYTKLFNSLMKGSERTYLAKKSILISTFLSGLNVLLSFVIIKISLDYLGKSTYGIWLTIYSIVEMFNLIDFGLSNGLRNRLSVALAEENSELAQSYISTTYGIISLIVLPLIMIFVIANDFINWSIVLNTDVEQTLVLKQVILFVFISFSIVFIGNIINSIFFSLQKPYLKNLLLFFTNSLKVISLYFIIRNTESSILYLGIINSLSPVFVIVIASALFYFKYPNLKPKTQYFNLMYAKELMGLGLKFFFIQISIVIILSTDNLIITQLLGAAEVTPYSIALKYFTIVLLIFSVLMSPIWSAVTEAYTKNDYNWIIKSYNKLKQIWFGLVFLVIIMILISNKIYFIWIGGNLKIPFLLSILMGLFAIMQTWNSIYGSFLNGIGKIDIQMYLLVFGALINVPLSIFFAKYFNLGSSGVILATCVSILSFSIIGPIQFYKIINKKAFGIWNQ